jgi:hypothetical protein
MLSVAAVQVRVALFQALALAATLVGAVGAVPSGAAPRVVLEIVAVWAEGLFAASMATTA